MITARLRRIKRVGATGARPPISGTRLQWVDTDESFARFRDPLIR